MSATRDYVARWALPDHDGLTAQQVRGAVILGWLTNDQASALVGSDESINTIIDTTPKLNNTPTNATPPSQEEES